jgi:hypothetical protein
VSLLRYELCFYIPENDILDSHRRENLKSLKYIRLVVTVMKRIFNINTRGKICLYTLLLCLLLQTYGRWECRARSVRESDNLIAICEPIV